MALAPGLESTHLSDDLAHQPAPEEQSYSSQSSLDSQNRVRSMRLQRCSYTSFGLWQEHVHPSQFIQADLLHGPAPSLGAGLISYTWSVP